MTKKNSMRTLQSRRPRKGEDLSRVVLTQNRHRDVKTIWLDPTKTKWISVAVFKDDTVTLTTNLRQKEVFTTFANPWNTLLDGLEALLVAHVKAGIDILEPRYQQGVREAVDAFRQLVYETTT